MRIVVVGRRHRVVTTLYGKVDDARYIRERQTTQHRVDMLDGYDQYLRDKKERDAEWERKEAFFWMKILRDMPVETIA